MHLGIPRRSDLKPRSRNKSILPAPATIKRKFREYNTGRTFVFAVVALLVINFVLKPLLFTSSSKSFGHLANKEALQNLQKNHGIYKNEIPVSRNYIFPPIEHAPLLRELTLDKIFKYRVNPENPQEKLYLYNEDEDLNDLNEIKDKSNDENPLDQALKAFKEHGHKVFRPQSGKKSPEIVVVTGVDFEKFEQSHLTKIVQNRVDYTHANGYGLYVRWIQEFIPLLQEFNNDKKWAKLFIMRAAMHAFPNAKYFWYLDQNAYILRNDIELESYILDPRALEPIMLRDQPIVLPYGTIKTYKKTKAEDARIIITQNKDGVNTDSFIVKNDLYGKGFLEFWSDPLLRRYPSFNADDKDAVSHILQWHPVLLSKTTIVPGRTICSLHSFNSADEEDENLFYQDDDFVVNFQGCDVHHTCELVLDSYYKKDEEK